jgi:hypothetical protein
LGITYITPQIFNTDKSGVSKPLKNIFQTKALAVRAVVAKFTTTANDGKTYQIEHLKNRDGYLQSKGL